MFSEPKQSVPEAASENNGHKDEEKAVFGPIEQAIEEFRQGKMIILVDDEDRENEGDFVIAAEKVTPEAVNFMARNGRGMICLTLNEERAVELELSPMVEDNTALQGTQFTVTIDAKGLTSTGISATDRANTILKATMQNATPDDFARPGHIHPIISARVVCCDVPVTRKARRTLRISPGCVPWVSSAKS